MTRIKTKVCKLYFLLKFNLLIESHTIYGKTLCVKNIHVCTSAFHLHKGELDERSPTASPTPVPKLNPNYRQRKTRKTGLTTVELQKKIPELVDMATSSESTGRRSRIRALRPPRFYLLKLCNDMHL